MFRLPLFASSPIFSLTSQTLTTLLEHYEHLGPDERSHCDDLRRSGGFTQTVTPTCYEPKIIETNVIDSEAKSPEDLEPRRIELDRNLGTDLYQLLLEICRNLDKSYFQSQMHSEYDSAESIADSDLADGELRKMLASPLYLQNREDYEPSRIPIATVKPAALLQERGANAKRTQADTREEPGDHFKSSVFRNADPTNVGRSLLEGNKDHLLSQAKSELMRQEHQVGSLNNCISELQQQACA